MLRPTLCLGLLGLLVALPAAQAQAGANDPKISITLTVTPKSPTIALGATQSFKVDVQLTTQNIFCTSPGTVTVALEPKDTGLAGVTGSLPKSVDVAIRTNVAPQMASAVSGGNSTAWLEVTVARTAMPDHSHSFSITASTPATLPSGCQQLSSVPPPAATAVAEVSIKTGPASGTTGTGASGVSVGSCSVSVSAPGVAVNAAAPTCTTQKSFFVTLQLQIAVLLGVGLLRRRR